METPGACDAFISLLLGAPSWPPWTDDSDSTPGQAGPIPDHRLDHSPGPRALLGVGWHGDQAEQSGLDVGWNSCKGKRCSFPDGFEAGGRQVLKC